MAAKKDFGAINTGKVYATIEQATSNRGQQGTASPQEAAARKSALKTQGRKGCKAIRINMAFTPENHDFIKVMAKISGKTMTEFINLTIETYRKEHGEQYEAAKAIIEKL